MIAFRGSLRVLGAATVGVVQLLGRKPVDDRWLRIHLHGVSGVAPPQVALEPGLEDTATPLVLLVRVAFQLELLLLKLLKKFDA